MTVDRSKRRSLSVNFTVLSFKKPLLINFIFINSKLHLFSLFFTKQIMEEPSPFDLTDFSKALEPTHPKFQSPQTSSYPVIQIKWSFTYQCHVFAIQILSKIAKRQSQTKTQKNKYKQEPIKFDGLLVQVCFLLLIRSFTTTTSFQQTVTTTGEGGADEVWDCEKRCSHYMQSPHLPWWSEGNCSVFFTK